MATTDRGRVPRSIRSMLLRAQLLATVSLMGQGRAGMISAVMSDGTTGMGGGA